MERTIEKLAKEFKGSGEVAGIIFKQIAASDKSYLYECNGGEYFEVIIPNVTAKCLNFEKREYSDTEFKERYPKAHEFGIKGWTYPTFEKAERQFKILGASVQM